MTDETHTVELTAWEANWLRDIIRWAREDAEEAGRRRSANKIQRVESTVDEALPAKETLAEQIN